MVKKRKKRRVAEPLSTSCEFSDELWERVRPIFEKFWPKKGGSTRTC
ncbi:MAG: hypothetical protein KatS3mg105_2123 [Gemmatales bacterium]|nr:MAG: hypothetical protein KatS3mg105_2123 [Gemmatales bacterium]